MSDRVYNGLQAELVLFGEKDIDTITIPTGYSGCEVGGVTLYVTPYEGMEPIGQYGTCYYEDEDEVIFHWASLGKRIK